MCQFCEDLGLECDVEDVEGEESIWCDCGHLAINHELLNLREIEALKAGDIECGHCCAGEYISYTTPGEERLTYMWIDFKQGQSCDTVDDILDRPEDPCDQGFMKDISS